MSFREDSDVVVVGAGVLGVSVSYWISLLYDAKVTIVDLSDSAAQHTSSRNTGIIHRPFYLDPEKKKAWAQASSLSLPLWKGFSEKWGLPWRPMGTLNVALTDREEALLRTYEGWGLQNGMGRGELEVMEGAKVRALEPEVRCLSALLSKTDVSVDFGAMTRQLMSVASTRGVSFVGGAKAVAIDGTKGPSVSLVSGGKSASIGCKVVINAAGGGALELAHSCGLASELTQLNFRGEYWTVGEPFASKVGSNVYRPPRHPQFPFLDPHFVVRADGSRQIGPNAVLVGGPYVYAGFGGRSMGALFSRPLLPKLALATDGGFLRLVLGEWRSSISKEAMCDRVKKFLPGISTPMLTGRGVSGVRSSIVGPGGFVPEAILLRDSCSVHILNFNSPGATGAPSFAARVVQVAREAGLLEGLRPRTSPMEEAGWDFSRALGE